MDLNKNQREMIVDLIERVSLNERSFNKENEKTLKEVAEIFGASYDEIFNSYEEEDEDEGVESEVMLNFMKTLPTLSKLEPTKVVVHENSVVVYYNKNISPRDIEVADENREFEKILGQTEEDRLFLLDDYCFDKSAKVLELYAA